MLLAGAQEFDIDLQRSYMIGDRRGDIEAGDPRGNPHDLHRSRLPGAAAASITTYKVSSTQEALTIIENESEPMKKIEDLKVKIFADGADKAGMLEMYAKPFVKRFDHQSDPDAEGGYYDYKAFSLDILKAIPDRPISLEVFSDDFDDMERQAMEIASWGRECLCQNPGNEHQRETSYSLIEKLAAKTVKLNVTALMTLDPSAGRGRRA